MGWGKAFLVFISVVSWLFIYGRGGLETWGFRLEV